MKTKKSKVFSNYILLAILALIGISCSSGSSGNSLAACGEGALFSVSPIETASIKAFVPIGRLNPSAHTLPTRHMYYYLNADSETGLALAVDVRAPSNLQITRVTLGTNLSDDSVAPDYSLTFNVCGEVEGYFGHVSILSDALLAVVGDLDSGDCTTYETGGVTYRSCSQEISLDVLAGDVLGQSRGMDFGLRDTRSSISFANEDRVSGSDMANVVCAYNYFETGLRNELEPLLADPSGEYHPTRDPLCGTVDVDVAGTTQGMWFSDQSSTINEGEDEHMALAPHNVMAEVQVFSIGRAVPTIESDPYEFTPVISGFVNRDFSTVSDDGNVYCYEVTNIDALVFVFLLRLNTDGTLDIEGIEASACGDGPWNFTGSQAKFYR